jgi:hypothetical protein
MTRSSIPSSLIDDDQRCTSTRRVHVAVWQNTLNRVRVRNSVIVNGPPGDFGQGSATARVLLRPQCKDESGRVVSVHV